MRFTLRTMDWFKYPLEKLVYFVAAFVPGSVVLLSYEFINPGSIAWFFHFRFLGYGTEIALLIVVCFIAGFSVTTFLRSIIGAFWGAYSNTRQRAFQPSYSIPTGPWRDPRWRAALKRHLDITAPNDTLPMSSELLEARKNFVNALIPEDQRAQKLVDLQTENFKYNQDDTRWSQWYGYYHTLVLHPPTAICSITWVGACVPIYNRHLRMFYSRPLKFRNCDTGGLSCRRCIGF